MKVLRWLFRVSAPILILEYFVLFFVSRNLHENLTATDIVPPMVVALIIGVLLIGVARLFMKSLDRAVLTASAWAVLISTYILLQELLVYQWNIPIRYLHLYVLYGMIAIIAPILIRFLSDKAISTTSLALVVSGVVLLTMQIVSIAHSTYVTSLLQTEDVTFPSNESSEISIDSLTYTLGYMPDIYHIILDGYSRDDVLSELYDFDNTDFLEYLVSKGFYIAHQSRSNYDLTWLSMPSTLESAYIEQQKYKLYAGTRRNIERRMTRFLHNIGYMRHVVPSSIEMLPLSVGIERKTTDFHIFLIERTPVYPFLALQRDRSSSDGKTVEERARDSYRDEFDKIVSFTHAKPIYVYYHSMITHAKFVLTADGKPPQRKDLRSRYIEVIKYTNQLLMRTIDTILDRYEGQGHKPVIILQADHGQRVTMFNEMKTEPIFSDTSLILRDRVGIFNAYYLPGGGAKHLYPDITPVNTYRVILNEYFGTNLQMLEDVSYCRFSPLLDKSNPTFGPFVEIRGDSAVYYTKEREVKSVFHFPKRDTVDARQN